MKFKTTWLTRRARTRLCVGLLLLHFPASSTLTAGDLLSPTINDLQIGYCLHNAGSTFWLTVTTDRTVERIQVECPSGHTFVLSDAKTVARLRYWRYTEDSEDNAWDVFGDGDYVITLGYSDQTGQSTVISFMEEDGITGITPPRKPSIIDPGKLDGAVVFPAAETPVKFTWAGIDPNTDWVEFRVQSLDSPNDCYTFHYTGHTPFLTLSAGPVYFSEGSWLAEIAAFAQRDRVNADGIAYSCVRKAARSYTFHAYDGCDIEIAYIREFSCGEYVMSFAVNTDESVTAIQVRCPSGKVIAITEREVEDAVVEWEYEVASPFHFLSTFGDGDYVFTFSYPNGTSQSTTVPFAQSDGITPIPEIDVQPAITSPFSLNGRTFCTPRLTLEWANIDPDANRIILDREWNDGDDENFHYSDAFIFPHNRGFLSTRSDSFIFDAGKWEIDIEAFHSVMGRNADGFRYMVQKKANSDYTFYEISASCDM